MHSIYALIDPRTPEKFYYIGHTQTPKRRLSGHCVDKVPSPKRDWIQGLLAQGVRPQVKIIEQFEIGFPLGRERYWIKFFMALGHPLTNVNWGVTVDNDCPGPVHTPSTVDAWEAYAKQRSIAKAAKQIGVDVPRFMMLVKCRTRREVKAQFEAINGSDSILALQIGVHPHWGQAA
jgi:hypothetical protein